MRRTKIVATIGPASEVPEVLQELLRSGVNVVRLNMSHGEREEHQRRIAAVRAASKAVGKPVGIMLDLKGPEIRIGTFPEGRVALQEGQRFTFYTQPVEGGAEGVFVAHPGLVNDVVVGATLLLDDGNIELVAEEITAAEVRCRVKNSGVVSNRKKINLPGRPVSLPALAEKDIEDIRFGIEQKVDFIAVSFVRKAADVIDVRRLLEEAGSKIQIIAKIESQEGIDNLHEIIKVADGLMVARGDLGVEVPAEEIPLHQKQMIELANSVAKPVITATQMLESMIHTPRPTRAEASDVANAILDGTDAVMLSAESAVGKYPVEAVRMMARIAERTEGALDYRAILLKRGNASHRTVTDAISHATVTTAEDLGAVAIVTATNSGHTARMVSKYRPDAPIIAVTPHEEVVRKLTLVWGVIPVQQAETSNTDEMVERSAEAALQTGLVKRGDLVVITAGVPVGIPGTTNLIKVHIVGEVVIRGQGMGPRCATGTVVVARSLEETRQKFRPGMVLVTRATDKDFMPFIEQAAALIVEEGGLTSHAAVVGLSLGLPVVVGAERATSVLADGAVVTVDAARGLIYRGDAG